MAFTDEERAEWHKAKREREADRPRVRPLSVAECIICHQPFGNGEGHWATEFPICGICDSD